LLYNTVGFRIGNSEGGSKISRTPLSFGAPYLGNSCEYSHKTRIIDLHFAPTVRIYRHSNFSGALRTTIFSAPVRFGRSRSSKVIDFGTNRKRVCDFLLVRRSNLGPVLHRFRDIAGFYARDPTPIPAYSHCTMLESAQA